MLNTLERLKISPKLMPMMFARILKLEFLPDHGLGLEISAKFLQLWMMEAISWTLMISDGDSLILVFRFQKKKVKSSLKNLMLTVVVKFIMLISCLILEET